MSFARSQRGSFSVAFGSVVFGHPTRSCGPIACGCGIAEAWVKQVAEMNGFSFYTVQTYMGRFGASTIKPTTLYGNKSWLNCVVLRCRFMPRCDVLTKRRTPLELQGPS
eukprot:11384133-Alexandrium_andersonii.AAC.1